MGWEEIRTDVLTRIRAREWLPGGLMPHEEALAAQYSVSRMTVNRALQALADEGFIERKKRAGTRVLEMPTRRARFDISIIRQEVNALGKRYDFRLVSEADREMPAAVAQHLGLEAGAMGRHLVTLHLADGAPFALEDRWLNLAALPALPDFSNVSANEWLVSQVPFFSGDLAFSAALASDEEAALLELNPRTALFITERTTTSTAGPITHVRLAHGPGYRVEMSL